MAVPTGHTLAAAMKMASVTRWWCPESISVLFEAPEQCTGAGVATGSIGGVPEPVGGIPRLAGVRNGGAHAR